MPSAERVLIAGAVLLLSVVTYNEVMNTGAATASSSSGGSPVDSVDSLLKHSNPSKHFSGPVIKFLYCYSCGYKRLFEEFANMVHQNFPEIEVEGDNYPPPPIRSYMASALGGLKMAFILCVVTGFDPFPALGLQTPAFMVWACENKFYSSMMAFFVSNAIEGQLISTGAFEVSFNGVEVWSKLRSGRPPSAHELFEILQSHSSSASSSFTGGGPGSQATGGSSSSGNNWRTAEFDS